MSTRLRCIPLVVMMAFAGSCATSPNATRVIEGGVTVRVAPRLAGLPRDATYAWVPPDSLIGRLNARDRELSADGGVDLVRRDVDIVLRGHGWRTAAAEDAEYILTLAHVDRLPRLATATRVVSRVQCPASAQGRPECVRPVSDGGSFTTEPPARTTGDWLSRVIRRRADGAQSVSMLPVAGMKVVDLGPPVAEQMLRLFLADERAR